MAPLTQRFPKSETSSMGNIGRNEMFNVYSTTPKSYKVHTQFVDALTGIVVLELALEKIELRCHDQEKSQKRKHGL